LVSRGWDTREAIELRAYTQELKQADTFSLSENYRKFFKEMKDYYAKQIRAGNTHPMFETTENGAKQAYEFRSKQFWKEMEKELAAANAINVDWRKYLVASGDYPPEMGDTPDDDGDDEVTAETLNREAQRCGFVSRAPNLGDPWSTWGSLERSRWGTFGRGMGLFGLERKTTVDELRAMIFLARVCTDRSVRNAECGDRAGITAIEKGWSDPNFVKHAKGRQSDYPSEDYTIFSCVRRVAAAITVPVDLNRLQGVAKQYLRDEDAHWAAMFSGHDRQADRDARRTKGGSGDSSSGGGSSSIPDKDFSHARDAIRGYGGGVRF
ncbi:MAG: hypothetical protein HY074_10410, partial [Deltaproteobacteria bacterium]|nr:hypothetical protein [Deltaproteobacteria bacterium]